jgi:predicted nucleotidyltransferase
MDSPISFPTPLHKQVAELVTTFFMPNEQVDSVLVVNSCARGQAISESDLDLAVLLIPSATAQDVQDLESSWKNLLASQPLLLQFKRSSRFAQVHLDFFNGEMLPTVWDDGGGPDGFELEIGNRLAYAAPLSEAGSYFLQLQSQWLPYYDNDLRLRRLAMVREACAYDLEHVPFSLRRGLYFHAFDLLYKAFQEFLQALFIARRTYPIAYNKWVREQVELWLGLADLYSELPAILSVSNIESTELSEKAKELEILLERWVQP